MHCWKHCYCGQLVIGFTSSREMIPDAEFFTTCITDGFEELKLATEGSNNQMKISIDVDITPDELRSFLGLPNVGKLQEQMLKRAQESQQDAGQSQYADMVSGAMQPLCAYQNWVQRMLTGADAKPAEKGGKGDSSE